MIGEDCIDFERILRGGDNTIEWTKVVVFNLFGSLYDYLYPLITHHPFKEYDIRL
jgi:hypothetical protein